MTLYMMITKDKYELPLAVADSVIELTRIVGVTPNTISSTICHHERGKIKKSKYIRVEVEGKPMTKFEAIVILNGFNLRNNADKYDIEALDMAIEALEKQIPKKPILKREIKCPKCGWDGIVAYAQDGSDKYCSECGQALDWSEYYPLMAGNFVDNDTTMEN